jgi:hypothetical protein
VRCRRGTHHAVRNIADQRHRPRISAAPREHGSRIAANSRAACCGASGERKPFSRRQVSSHHPDGAMSFIWTRLAPATLRAAQRDHTTKSIRGRGRTRCAADAGPIMPFETLRTRDIGPGSAPHHAGKVLALPPTPCRVLRRVRGTETVFVGRFMRATFASRGSRIGSGTPAAQPRYLRGGGQG